MKILIPVFSPSIGAMGSLTRTICFAEHYKKKGNEVAFCASGYVAKKIREKGFEVFEMPEPTFMGVPRFLSDKLSKKTSNMTPPFKEGRDYGSLWFVFLISGLLSRGTLVSLVKSEINAVEDFKPDFLFTEMDIPAFFTSQVLNLPLVSTYAKIMTHKWKKFLYNKAKRVLRAVFRKFGLPKPKDPFEMMKSTGILKLIPSIPELDGTPEGEENTVYVGNLISPVQKENGFKLPEGKKIYFAYFGTGSVSFQKAKEVLSKVFSKRDDAVCYFSSGNIKTPYEESNVIFGNYFPADKIIPYAEWVFCHGGLNTVTGSLESGTPLLLFPGGIFERRHNSRMTEKAGGGYFGELSNFNEEWIRDKMSRREELSGSLEKIQERFKSYSGMNDAEKAVTNYLTSFSAKN